MLFHINMLKYLVIYEIVYQMYLSIYFFFTITVIKCISYLTVYVYLAFNIRIKEY